MKAKSVFAKVDAYIRDRDTRPGILARQLTGREKPGDKRLAEILASERRARTRMDGSIDGSLVRTAWAAWELMDLGADTLHAGLDRLVSWTLAQVESSTPPSDAGPLTLPNGAAIADAEGAAFAARCLGLRVLIRARREARPRITQLVDELASGPQPPTLDLSACALAALALMPPPHRRHLDGLVNRLGRAQGSDGGWAGEADLFHMLEALVLAGIRPARAVVAQAAPALARGLREDGSFDDPPHDALHDERALIGLRALQIAIED